MNIVKEKVKDTFNVLKKSMGWNNIFEAVRIEKIVVSVGTGKIRKDSAKVELIKDRLAKITGQFPAYRKSRVSIAAFKLREGEVVGQIVTMRGERMYSFLDRFIHIALPRTKDFRGISRDSVDEMGNLTIGVKEHTIFPETSDENLQDVFGMAVTIVSTEKDKEKAIHFFEHIGIPFKKAAVDKN